MYWIFFVGLLWPWPLATKIKSKYEWILMPNVKGFFQGVPEILHSRGKKEVLCEVTMALTIGHQVQFRSTWWTKNIMPLANGCQRRRGINTWRGLNTTYWIHCMNNLSTFDHQNVISSSLILSKCLYQIWRHSFKLILRYHVHEKHTLWGHCALDLWLPKSSDLIL